jgi:putative oxidoreductase
MGEAGTAVLLLRSAVGIVFIVHGLNHAIGGGKLPGTARWFASLGMRHAPVHAVLSVATETAAGVALVLGLAVPLATGALVGVCVVAAVIAHARNGFFVFEDGMEYVLVLAIVCLAVALAGPGRLALDRAFGWDTFLHGWASFTVAAVVGLGGAAFLLLLTWRPQRDDKAKTPASLSESS